MPVKYLDLDAIHKPNGKVKIAGSEYDVYPISVKALINLSLLGDDGAVDEENVQEGVENIGKALDVISEIFPDCPREILDTLTLEQINALIEFCNKVGADTVEKNSLAPRKTTKTKK